MKVCINSKNVNPGDVFVAIKGSNYDGHDFIDDAINRGASLIIAEHGTYSVDTMIVDDTRKYLPIYLNKLYGDKIKKLKIIGVTGTNGKTTCSYLIYQALRMLEIKSSYIGTIGFYIDGKICDLDRTTPESNDIYDMLLQCVDNDVLVVVMEVSSHSLDQNRVDLLNFCQAIFTNLTSDHLDYHKTLENYRDAKSKLFRYNLCGGDAIINIDDDNSKYMIFDKNNNITYGFGKSDYQIINYYYQDNKMYFNYKYKNSTYNIMTNIYGKHNVYNIMSLIASINALGIDINLINDVILHLLAPAGRFEIIDYGTNKIIIDYAHTYDAVKKVLNTAKEFSKSKIYCIIGCGGNRDASKRSIMANIALSMCDKVIFTSDNPRGEDPLKIIDDMIFGNECYSNYSVITDRSKAIKDGILMLNDNDILMILGKGHENYQIIGDIKYHFDDKEEVLKYIKKR